jgi:centractin
MNTEVISLDYNLTLYNCNLKFSIGVHDCLVKSIMKADIDIRRILFSQIVLSGGSTLFKGANPKVEISENETFIHNNSIHLGFGERLLNEIRRHQLSPKETKIRIAAPPERLYSTWIGGSILASLATFKNMWITKSEYFEQGDRVFKA